jgi:hypothetical protein
MARTSSSTPAGHSAGAIFTRITSARRTPFRSLQLLAPAIRIDEYHARLHPLLGGVVQTAKIYTMRDKPERDDVRLRLPQVAPLSDQPRTRIRPGRAHPRHGTLSHPRPGRRGGVRRQRTSAVGEVVFSGARSTAAILLLRRRRRDDEQRRGGHPRHRRP